MRLKKLLAVTLVLAMTVSMFTACGKKDSGTTEPEATTETTEEATDTTPAADTQATGDTSAYPGTADANAITVNIVQEPPEMCSITTTDTVSFDVIRHVIENLVMLDENDKAVPGVATDWTVSDDGLVYTFNLRQDMKWSNGEPVTANDFIFAWTSLLTPSFAADYAAFGYIFKNGREFNEGTVTADQLGFKALDDYKLEITLAYPAPYFLSTLAFGVFAPVNEKAYNEFGTAYGTDADKMVYNGAFTMTSWEHESKIVLTKNPDYYDADKVELETINMVMINDSNAAMNSFKAGEVDMIAATGDQAAMMKAENYPVNNFDDASVWYLEFNMNDPQLANVNLRKAIALAFDKQAFVDSIIKNSSKPAASYTAPAINGFEKKFADEVGTILPVVDVEKAKEYLAKAKEELGTDEIKLSIICDDTDVAIQRTAFFQEQLKVNLGIEVEVESMPMKSRIERMSNKDFSIVFAGWGPDYNDPMTYIDMFETGNGNNHTSYTSAAYDELLGKIRTELDPKTRFGYLMDAEKLLLEDMPIAPIYWRTIDYLVSGKIASGVIRTAFQDMNFKYVKLVK